MKIRIKKKNRGKFTALLKRTGKSASWFKEHGTPLQRKRATFALNARHWRHGDGGFINTFEEGGDEDRVPWYRLPVRVPNMTGTATAAATSLRDIPLTESTVGRELAVAGTAMLPLAPYLGHSAAVGIDTMGRMAMPSTLLKGVSYYAPKVAGALSAVSPWLDAGALSLWSAEAGKAAIDAKRQGRTSDAIGMGTLAALPIVMPLVMKAYQGMKTGLRMKPFEIGNVSSAELYDPIVGHSTAPPEAYLAEEIARENAEIARLGRETLLAEPTDLNFFNNKALRLMAEQGNVKAAAELATRPYEVENLGGGYMLKSLMRGNPLEKQISKNGTVNVNNVRALVGKGSKVEQAVVDKVLASEEFAGKKSIDYNKFRKAVQDELITYERVPNEAYAEYGMDRIGQKPQLSQWSSDWATANNFIVAHPELDYAVDDAGNIFAAREVPGLGKIYDEPVPWEEISQRYPGWKQKYAMRSATPETFTFESSRIPNGSAKHYGPNTLGHSRTYTTADEPDVLHVMESQSDWAQGYTKKFLSSGLRSDAKEFLLDHPELKWEVDLRHRPRNGEPGILFIDESGNSITIPEMEERFPRWRKKLTDNHGASVRPQMDYLSDNFTSRQIQENLRYAAEKGQTKMRYPTRETAAKIEGYQPATDTGKAEEVFDWLRENNRKSSPYSSDIYEKTKKIETAIENDLATPEDIKRAKAEIKKLEALEARWLKGETTYNADLETILYKYEGFPKEYQKLYKNADVRIVTDPRGNTWYEVDVPEGYLQQEWAYKNGGSLILPKMMIDKYSPDKLRKAIANLKARQKK